MIQESKNLVNNVITIIIIVVANVIISYIMTNKVASTMVIRDNVKIEQLEKQAELNRTSIIQLDASIIGRDVFNSTIIIIKEQNDITRQMIIAHERRNETEFRRLGDQYDILEKLFEKQTQLYRNQSTTGGQIK